MAHDTLLKSLPVVTVTLLNLLGLFEEEPEIIF